MYTIYQVQGNLAIFRQNSRLSASVRLTNLALSCILRKNYDISFLKITGYFFIPYFHKYLRFISDAL